MNEQLSPEEVLKVAMCRDEWLHAGLSTEPINEVEITGAVQDLYHNVLGRTIKNVPVIFTQGPFEAWVCTVLAHMIISGVRDSSSALHKEIFIGREYMHLIDESSIEWSDRKIVQNAVGNSMRPIIVARSAVASAVYETEIRGIAYSKRSSNDSVPVDINEKMAKVIDKCINIIAPYVKGARDFQAQEFIDNIRDYILGFAIPANGLGQFAADDLLMYEVADILGARMLIDLPQTLHKTPRVSAKVCKDSRIIFQVIRRLSNCGFVFPLRKVCIVSERPTDLHVGATSVLHRDNGPCVKFRDGVQAWMLNGILMPSDIIMTPAEKLDVKLIGKTRNADIRREIVRKIGIERVCNDLKARIIESGLDHNGMPCELIMLDIGDNLERPYVKLRNPSVPGIYHIEGVHPSCRSLKEVWKFRNGSNEKPIILT